MGRLLWEIYGVFYDVIFFSSPHRKMIQDIKNGLNLKKGGSLLDAGCGSGTFIIDVSKADLNITGIDFSGVMLFLLKLKSRLLRIRNKNLTLIQRDLNLPLNILDNSQDYVVSINVIFSLSDPKLFIQELTRVTKNRGRVFVVAPSATFNIRRIVEDHVMNLRSQGLRGYIKLFLQAVFLSMPLLMVGVINQMIEGLLRSGKYQQLGTNAIVTFMESSGLKVIDHGLLCADQEVFVVGQKV